MKRALVIGSGQRVREAALPALLSRPDDWQLAGIRSRKAKTIEAAGVEHRVAAFDEDGGLAASLDSVDLVYACVSKGAVPSVLSQLEAAVRQTGATVDLLIDTPVLLFKHLASYKRFAAFHKVWVAEDMWSLPWVDTIERAREALDLGAPKRLILSRSAYAYHGLALAKTLLDEWRLVGAKRWRTGVVSEGEPKSGETTYERRLTFAGGRTCEVSEPRDYSLGGFLLECERGAIADRPGHPGAHVLEPILDEGVTADAVPRWLGFRIGEVETHLGPHEVKLFGEAEASSVIARMDALKRVGFARLFDRITEGRGAYPLVEGIDDMWVDYTLEKVGRWRATPLTSARSGLARGLMGSLTSLAGKVKG